MSTPHEPPQKKKPSRGAWVRRTWAGVKREWQKAVREVREGVQETQKRMKERDEWLVEKCRQNSIGGLGRWFDTGVGLILFVGCVYGFGWLVYWAVGYFFPDVFSEVGVELYLLVGFFFPDIFSDEMNKAASKGLGAVKEKPSELLRNRFWIVWMVGTATFATAGIWFTNRARRNREKGLAIEQQQLNSERFQKAVVMLSDEKSITRLGGLYVLRDLAKENPKQEHIRCLDIVSDWLRENYPVPPKENQNEQEDKQLTRNSDYLLAIFSLDQKSWSYAQKYTAEQHRRHNKQSIFKVFWPNLSLINFSDAYMQGFDFTQSNFSGAYFNKVDLTEANLSRAFLFKTDLHMTDLQGTDLHWASLQKTILSGANLLNVKNLTKEQLESARWDKDNHPLNVPKDLLPLPHDGTGSSDKK